MWRQSRVRILICMDPHWLVGSLGFISVVYSIDLCSLLRFRPAVKVLGRSTMPDTMKLTIIFVWCFRLSRNPATVTWRSRSRSTTRHTVNTKCPLYHTCCLCCKCSRWCEQSFFTFFLRSFLLLMSLLYFLSIVRIRILRAFVIFFSYRRDTGGCEKLLCKTSNIYCFNLKICYIPKTWNITQYK